MGTIEPIIVDMLSLTLNSELYIELKGWLPRECAEYALSERGASYTFSSSSLRKFGETVLSCKPIGSHSDFGWLFLKIVHAEKSGKYYCVSLYDINGNVIDTPFDHSLSGNAEAEFDEWFESCFDQFKYYRDKLIKIHKEALKYTEEVVDTLKAMSYDSSISV